MSGHEFKQIHGNTYFRWEGCWLRIEPTAFQGWHISDVLQLLFDLVGWIERREAAFVTAQPPENVNEHEPQSWTPAVGDTVILRGQPERILTVVCPDSCIEGVRCEWFDVTGNVAARSFPRLALVLVSANPRRESP